MMRQETAALQTKTRTRPLIWVKQLVLYESIAPVKEIRRMDFTTGLNIIRGVGDETNAAFESGHGIGKTTLCRLLRYCLGEQTFGQRHVVEEIKYCLPDGYVGAVVEVGGTDWAVLRPLGNRRSERAQENQTLDGLLSSVTFQDFDAFVAKVTTAVLSDIPVTESLTGNQTLQWRHVLALCSRDQESRYDRFWNWRDARSESGTPKFNKPKVDAGLCLRAIIGLLDPKESRLRATLDQLAASLEKTQATLKEKRAEPNFHITRLRNSLANDCGVQDAVDAPLDEGELFGLPMAVNGRLEALRRDIAEIGGQIAPLDRQITLAAASLLDPADLKGQLEAASEVTGEGTNVLLSEIETLRNVRQLIKDAEYARCKYGDVMIGQCSIVKDRQEHLDDELREKQRTTLPIVSEREQQAARLAEQANRQQSVIGQVQRHLDDLNRHKNALLEQQRSLNEQARRIPFMLTEIQDWNAILQGKKPNTEVQSLENDVARITLDIGSAQTELATLIAAQADRVKLFESRFDDVVEETLTAGFKGIIEIEEEGVDFHIRRGESLSGEAYETLAILLADLSLLFDSNAEHVHHPGILIHDSPREADLNLRIYQKLLDMAEAEMRTDGQKDDVPYQYIVTTTTSPSEQLQKKAVTTYSLSGGTGSLFRRQLETAKATPMFFDDGQVAVPNHTG